ncbi:MAG TPA: undecaprenyl-diphosphate phosphatase [Thermoanaerobaculia bacterium]|nr:undecaprenyl-diphosphate phosphatase [Thermoanaerobaculia bacterium]
MTLLQAAILGVVQGITEFLPISSSAHLILAPRVLGWADQGLHFDIAAHLGTFLAVLVYFRGELAAVTLGAGASPSGGRGRLPLALWVGTIPVAVVGLAVQDFMEAGARSPRLIACTSIVFGLLLAAADRWARRERRLDQIGVRDALLIGAAQALALLPGTSRSGVTITAGRLLRFERAEAARFAFLLSLPVGILIAAKDAYDLARSAFPATQLPAMAVGLASAALSGYLVIGWLLAWLRRRSLMVFAVYRVLLGILILILAT